MTWWPWFSPEPVVELLDMELVPSVALDVALQQIGNGEEWANNRGQHIDRYYKIGLNRRSPGGPWCAAFVSYCFVEAAAHLDVGLRFKTSAGAKRLAHNVARTGTWLARPRPGGIVCWHRGHGAARSWQGHVGIVKFYDPYTDRLLVVEGNRGVFPSRVKVIEYDDGNWRENIVGVAWPTLGGNPCQVIEPMTPSSATS